jgi:hypothetical protein
MPGALLPANSTRTGQSNDAVRWTADALGTSLAELSTFDGWLAFEIQINALGNAMKADNSLCQLQHRIHPRHAVVYFQNGFDLGMNRRIADVLEETAGRPIKRVGLILGVPFMK